ncbi:hypothetical protein V6N11_083026 [Hibiscus sabdariffa]|uniref:RNase H type-1 domain-containing protein n=1 Tax=Hibiscus sabdariffa TaxID=183260 RepID=A0ABR2QKN8_9ROSI
MVDEFGQWQLFEHLLPASMLLRIATLKIPSSFQSHDRLCGGLSSDKKFIVRSMRNEWIFGNQVRHAESVLQRSLRIQRDVVAASMQLSTGRKPVPNLLDFGSRVMGSLRGLVAAWSISVRRLLVESDGLEAVNLINYHGSFDVVPTIVYSIIEILNRSWLTKISHVGQDSNCAADWMAKQATFNDLLCHRYLSPPDDISLLLQQDVAD